MATFEGMEGIDRLEHITSMEWTTAGNKRLEPILNGAGLDTPHSVKRANLVLDCNSAFIEYEREHRDLAPPYGIAEFWLRHHNLYRSGANLLPAFSVTTERQAEVDTWLAEQTDKVPVGIVLRAGDPVRDWNFDNRVAQVADWLYTSGYCPVTIDPFKRIDNLYTAACVGRRLDFVAGVLGRCKVVLTPDTGLLHLAQAMNTRTVALWGIMEPRLRIAGYDTVIVPKHSLGFCPQHDPSCRCPWKFQQWSCLKRITLNQIINGLQAALTND